MDTYRRTESKLLHLHQKVIVTDGFYKGAIGMVVLLDYVGDSSIIDTVVIRISGDKYIEVAGDYVEIVESWTLA